MRDLIADFTDEGDLIIDPFAGSGSTLLAAAQLGRHAIGFERDAARYQTAQARLAGDEYAPAPGQLSLLSRVTP